jgi:hypothetical protein
MIGNFEAASLLDPRAGGGIVPGGSLFAFEAAPNACRSSRRLRRFRSQILPQSKAPRMV